MSRRPGHRQFKYIERSGTQLDHPYSESDIVVRDPLTVIFNYFAYIFIRGEILAVWLSSVCVVVIVRGVIFVRIC